MSYAHEEVHSATTTYFGGDPLATDVWIDKYALRNPKLVAGLTLLEKTPDDMHWRLARGFARVEAKYPNPMSEDEIYGLFKDFKYVIPQGSPQSGIGNPYQLQSLSNCYVIESPIDSYGGIFKADQEFAQIMKRRGGVGVDLSTLRYAGAATTNAARTSTGLGTFMERKSNTTREVGQDGRRGAAMLSASVHHPDIHRFIEIKNDKKECPSCGHEERDKVTGANVSVRYTNEFLKAVDEGTSYEQRFPVDAEKPEFSRMVPAQEVWDSVIDNAWNSAEPGALFWDRIISHSLSDIYADLGYQTVSTNPCGEVPLSVGDSCRLLVLNLTGFVQNPYTEDTYFDFELFHDYAMKAQRLMDDLVDLELEKIDLILAKVDSDPEPEHVKAVERDLWTHVREAAVNGRRTGLGITGLGDALAALGLRYGSDASLDAVEDIYRALAVSSHTSSIQMAEERGAFPVFDLKREEGHVYMDQILNALPKDVVAQYRKFGRRNIANTTTAPAGSLSIEAQVSNGIEPCFDLMYMRRKKVNPGDANARVDFKDDRGDCWQHFQILHHGFEQWCRVTGREVEDVKARMQSGDMRDVEASPYYKALANDLDWVKRVEAQGRAQRWVDHAISSTVNLPEDVSKETVHAIYMAAWKSGCKGITIYRQHCRTGVLVQKGRESEAEVRINEAPKRPKDLKCQVHRMKVKHQGEHTSWIFLVGLMGSNPYEVIGGRVSEVDIPEGVGCGVLRKRNLSKSAKYDFVYTVGAEEHVIKDVVHEFDNPDQGLMTRMISACLRHGMPAQHLVGQLGKDRDADLFSFARGVSRVLKQYIPDGSEPGRSSECPACEAQGSLAYQAGCLSCTSCGYSKCD